MHFIPLLINSSTLCVKHQRKINTLRIKFPACFAIFLEIKNNAIGQYYIERNLFRMGWIMKASSLIGGAGC